MTRRSGPLSTKLGKKQAKRIITNSLDSGKVLFFEDAEDDVNLVDSIFCMGGSISKGIPWNTFSELELQQILKIHFENIGFNIIWRHLDDPANERGIDLECSHEKSQTKILVAVKKKPRKEALSQILELMNEPAKKHIYVYVGGSTQSFRDQIIRFSDIEFWDETKLEESLNESGLTLRLKVDNTLANRAIFVIMGHILESINTKPITHEMPKPTAQIMMTLWGMKDRAVTVNKCAGMIQLMLEDSRRIGKLTDKQVQNLVVWCFDYIYAYGLLSLQNAFKFLSPELRSLFYYVHEITAVRSNWLELYHYQPGLQPGIVKHAAQQIERSKEEWKVSEKILEKIENEDEKLPPQEGLDLLQAAEEFRQLAIWADGLEGTIDYIFEQCATGSIKNA
jgi:hypothetical protein